MKIPLNIPPGLNTDDTTLAASPAWVDCDNARFVEGRPQAKGGYESVVGTLLTGVCRSILCWTDNSKSNTQNIAFGTHTNLQLYQGGVLYDITPTKALPAVTLGANPVATTNGSPTVVITQPGHPYIIGDSQVISGASAVATVTINGTWTVTAVTTNTWTFTAGSNANATTTGGGSAVVVTPQRAFAAGAVDGTGSDGYGAGAWGVGPYGEPSGAEYYPRTVALAPYGQTLIANPRGQTLFQWSNDTSQRAVAISGAPAICTYSLVARRFLFALGCSQEVGGAFNPLCIRHSSLEDPTSWTTDITSGSTSREYILPGGGRIVGGRTLGKDFLVWTSHKLFYASYVGQIGEVWTFDEVGDKCGLIGPNAAVVLGSTAYWISPDRQIHSYTVGGTVQSVGCPIRVEFAENLSASQGDKIVASSVSEYNEIRFDYPDSRDGHENSRYISADVQMLAADPAKAWHKGQQPRTAMVDAGPTSNPCATTFDGHVYWHERGNTADGAALTGFIETADIYLDNNYTVLTRGFWPDIARQIGPLFFDITSRIYPQGPVTTYPQVVVAPGQARADFKAKGRLFRIRISWNSAPAENRIGMPIFDAKLAGMK